MIKDKITTLEAFSRKRIMVHNSVAANNRAAFAMRIMERLALIAAEDDGEDSAGRSKRRRSSPDEIVAFSCGLAARAFEQFEQNGWLFNVDIPAKDED